MRQKDCPNLPTSPAVIHCETKWSTVRTGKCRRALNDSNNPLKHYELRMKGKEMSGILNSTDMVEVKRATPRACILFVPKSKLCADLQAKYRKIKELSPPKYGWMEFSDWIDSTRRILEHGFGKGSDQEREFMQIEYAPGKNGIEILRMSPHSQISTLSSYDSGLSLARRCLVNILEEITNYCKENTEESVDIETSLNIAGKGSGNLWHYVHPRVCELAKPRFESEQYADAVESAFKEINVVVKNKVEGCVPKSLDGVQLMQKVFSPDNPLLQVESDLERQSNIDTQRGYMFMLAGAMAAIRNPKAHENMEITKEDAIRKLHFASMLMYKIDNSILVGKEK